MAFRSNGPVTLTLPPFRGVTRRIILIALVSFFAVAILGLFGSPFFAQIIRLLMLQPWFALRRAPWQLLTYAFFPSGLLSTLFALLSLWFFGSLLEDERGPRWFLEYFLAATIGGALLASILSFALGSQVPQLGPINVTAGMWPAVLAILLAFAHFHADQEIRLYFILNLKAKYLVAIYLLVYLALALVGRDQFGAMTAVCTAAAGFVYLRFAPRQGIGFAGSESLYSLRNAYYRAKRRRAAKKFTVYMRKQGKEVNIDSNGRYIDPNGTPRDPNDRRWMN